MSHSRENDRSETPELGDALRRLLGPHASPALAAPPAAAALAAEFEAAYLDAEGHEWALVAQTWPDAPRAAMTEVLHRIGRLVGARPVWLLRPGISPRAVALDAATVLDNPLGFAGLEDDDLLALWDADAGAGLRLARQGEGDGTRLEHEWQLEVWGEPWLSATTRALRGIG